MWVSHQQLPLRHAHALRWSRQARPRLPLESCQEAPLCARRCQSAAPRTHSGHTPLLRPPLLSQGQAGCIIVGVALECVKRRTEVRSGAVGSPARLLGIRAPIRWKAPCWSGCRAGQANVAGLIQSGVDPQRRNSERSARTLHSRARLCFTGMARPCGCGYLTPKYHRFLGVRDETRDGWVMN